MKQTHWHPQVQSGPLMENVLLLLQTEGKNGERGSYV